MSTNIKRISMEEGAALFERTGLIPKPGVYVDQYPGKCGCLVGAIVVDADGFDAALRMCEDDEESVSDRAETVLGLDWCYVVGLIGGFDDPDLGDHLAARDPQTLTPLDLGRLDGAAIRQRVLPVAAGSEVAS